MRISVELTFSPLKDGYDEPIIDFIKRLRASGLGVKENALSTQVFGEYDEVMSILTEEIKESLEEVGVGLMWMKIVSSDRENFKITY